MKIAAERPEAAEYLAEWVPEVAALPPQERWRPLGASALRGAARFAGPALPRRGRGASPRHITEIHFAKSVPLNTSF